MSANLRAFRTNYLHADSWELRKDGPPLHLLDRLNEEERRIAEEELIAQLNPGDDWPVRGLAQLRSTKALPALRELLRAGKPAMQTVVAHAIWKISGDADIIPVFLESCGRLETEHELIELVYLLPDFKDPRTDALLASYRDHAAYLVAYNAARAAGLPIEPVVRRFQQRKS